MSKHYFSQFGVQETDFFIKHIEDNVTDYNLNELVGGNAGDEVGVTDAHPLALEYGNMLSSNDNNYKSILPAVGVELVDDGESEVQPMGQQYKPIEITQAFLDEVTAIALTDRFGEGFVLSDTVLAAIQAAKTDKGAEKLYGISTKYLLNQSLTISIWADHTDITKILYKIIDSLIKRSKLILSRKGVKNLRSQAQRAIYNYEFGKTLFGAEFNLSFMNWHKNVEVNTELTTIKEVEIYLSSFSAGGKFVTKGKTGEADQYPPSL